jgi:rod shape-determining protein MreD
LFVALALEIVPLPDSMQAFRPPFVVLALIYWIMMWPQRIGLGWAFLLGIALDIMHGQLLGQNAITLTIVAYLTLNFHLQIRIFPLWQLTMTVLALLSADVLIRSLIDGITGTAQAGFGPWIRVLVGTLLWPILMAILDQVRMGAETRPSDFD